MSTEKNIISAIEFTGASRYVYLQPWVRLMNMSKMVSKVVTFDEMFSSVDDLAPKRVSNFHNLLGNSPYAPSYRSFWEFAKEKNLDSNGLLRMVLAPRDVAHFVFPDEDRKQMQVIAAAEFESAVNSLAEMIESIHKNPDVVREIPVIAANGFNIIDPMVLF